MNEATGDAHAIKRIAPGWADGDDVPPAFYCPISKRVMMDPVFLVAVCPPPSPALQAPWSSVAAPRRARYLHLTRRPP